MIKHTLRCVDWLHCVADWSSWSWAVYRQAACITRETEMKACFNTLSVSITHLGYMPLNFIQLLPDFPGIFRSHRSLLLLLFSEFEFTHLVHILWAIHFSHSMYTFRHDGKKIGNSTPSRSFWNIHRIHLIWELARTNETRGTHTHTQFSNAYHSFLLSSEPVLFIYINSLYCIKGPIMNDGCAKREWWEKKRRE